MKALRDLGLLLLVLLGLFWLGGEPQAGLAPIENGTLTSAQWVLPPFPDALLEQKPVVQLSQHLPVISALRAPSQPQTAHGSLAQLWSYTASNEHRCLQGRLQQLHRIRLYPFHEFG